MSSAVSEGWPFRLAYVERCSAGRDVHAAYRYGMCRASRAGKQYYEPYGISPEAAVEVGLALLLRAKVGARMLRPGGSPWGGRGMGNAWVLCMFHRLPPCPDTRRVLAMHSDPCPVCSKFTTMMGSRGSAKERHVGTTRHFARATPHAPRRFRCFAMPCPATLIHTPHLLLRVQVARSTEGMLLSSQFPVNYFALGQVEQWYGDEFREEFERVTGECRRGSGTRVLGLLWDHGLLH